ncbi:hypothetical protein H5410_060179 [Solanum commersonii]|uniref:SWIM-type domain-containing protein n=1 Tax=Solanum commersonii TaxID=4109 RepID=A0A9J5W4D8_SOLCO|nr:hypothetical protein H5410_060179 [Solanum commersonii]
MCDTFNHWILGARFKSIITMLEEIRVKVMEKLNHMREFSEKWITNVAPMAMDILRKNVEIADNCEVKFNGDFGFEIHDPPYKHVVDLKKKVCSCRSWQLKGIHCGHALTTIHYKDWVVDTFVDHWYKKETYLKAYNRFIQPMTNMKMWPKSDRPAIEPPEITTMPGRPGKNRRKDSDEPVKKKFGKATRKGRKLKCSVCKTFGHNKKGCPTLKNVTAGTSAKCCCWNKCCKCCNCWKPTKCKCRSKCRSKCRLHSKCRSNSATRPTNASSSGVRPATALASGGRLTIATSSDVRQLSGSVTARSGNTDRVLHSATLSSSTPTNIDLGYKPNGLRWKGRAAITQRLLREESYRSTQGTH